ncbi:MAG: DUF6036 family nucleotidyltransferase [Nitrospirales bacterium]|nr:nucleotidyltransferase [Nitrospirales bacterium]
MAIFAPLFNALNKANVRYVVVGGLATVLHGYARLTVDIDLAVDLTPKQARKAISTLTKLGLVPQLPLNPSDFANPQTREAWTRGKNMKVFSMIDPQNPLRIVDLFVEDIIPFEELWSRSKIIQVDTLAIRVASLPDLIQLKRIAGRPQDLNDIDRLKQIQKLQEGESNG